MLVRSRVVAAVALAALLVLTGCKATADVAVDVDRDGSGTVAVTVRLDAEATAELGADARTALRLDDLDAAGWDVSGPTTERGAATVVLTKAFARPADLQGILDEVGGPKGVFRDWQLTSDDSFTHTDYRLSGTVELSGSLDQFSDADVATALDGLATGRTPDELAAALKDHPDALSVTVSARLPGERGVTQGFAAKDPESDGASRDFVLGSGSPTSVRMVLESSATERAGALWMFLGAGLIALALLLLAASARRRPKRHARPLEPGPEVVPDPTPSR